MIYSKYASRAIYLLAALPLLLTAQKAQNTVIPLKNWASPLYWQPNPAESHARVGLLPRGPDVVPPEPVFLTFVAMTPCRLVDTRGTVAGFEGGETPFNGPSLGAGSVTDFPVLEASEATGPDRNTGPAACGVIPAIAVAYSFNVTVIPHAEGVENYVTIWPYGATQPVVSTVNATQGLIVANAAIVAAGTSGSVNLYTSGPAIVDVVIDMNGYFAAPTDLNANTAVGSGTLTGDTTGYGNVAIGEAALTSNTSGADNVASGIYAMASNTSGSNNTASGQSALSNNTQGNFNTAYGNGALQYNLIGTYNTGIGNQALQNTTASYNTATGDGALVANIGGGYNTAGGYNALVSSTTGSANTAFGEGALAANVNGAGNIGLGEGAGATAPTGNSNSIYIGNPGTDSDVAGIIKIGDTAIQTGGTYIAGIYGATPSIASRALVCADSTGLIGTAGCQSLVDAVAGADSAVSPHAGQPALLKQLQNQAEQIRQQAEQTSKLENRLRAVETLLSGAPQPVR